MNDQIDEVKQKTDIVSLIADYIELKKAGSKYKALCPFHSEKTPSFVVSPELQIYKCFGCQASGDIFTFLEEYEGMEFSEALKFLAEKAGVKLQPFKGAEKGAKEKLFEINELVLKFYEYCLLKHPSGREALLYLTKDRGLTMDTIKKFRLGYSPDLPLALRKFVIERHKISYKDLEATGVTYTGGRGTFDRFRGRVIFPLFDQNGNIAGFSGRILPGSVKTELAKYINSPETLIYRKSKILFGLHETKRNIKKVGVAIVVEGEFDLINPWQEGIKNTVAIKGSALTEEQVKLLSRYTKKIVLALDEDFAGNEAAMRGIRIAEKEGFEIKVAKLAGFKDPADAAMSDPEGLKKSFNEAVDVWDFIINFVFTKYDGSGGSTKAKISKELIPLLSTIEDKIVQAHYVNLTAKKLGVPIEAVFSELSKNKQLKAGFNINHQTAEKEATERTRREILEEKLLSLLFKLNPELVKKKKIVNLLKTPFSKRLVSFYLEYKTDKFELLQFSNTLPDEIKPGFSDLIMKDIDGEEKENTDDLDEEVKLVVKNLEIYDVKNELSEVGETIKNYEDGEKLKELNKAQNKFTKLTKKLAELEARDIKGIIF